MKQSKTWIKQGRISKEWRQVRETWVKNHSPNHQGAWVCYLCGQWVYKEDMELDHVESKGNEHRFVIAKVVAEDRYSINVKIS